MEKFLLQHKFNVLDLCVLTIGIMVGQAGLPWLGFLEIVAGSFLSTRLHEVWTRKRGG